MNQRLAKKISQLTDRQREVLRLRCEALEYQEIGRRLYIEENTVKQHIQRVYLRLYTENLTEVWRYKILFEEICPILHSRDLPPAPSESVNLPPIPPYVIRQVDDDEALLNRLGKEGILALIREMEKQSAPGAGRSRWLWAALGLLMLSALVVADIAMRLWQPSITANNPTIAPIVLIQTEIVTQIVTTTPDLNARSVIGSVGDAPALTPVIQTVVVTATPPPATQTPAPTAAPEVLALFEDDFTSSASSLR